MMKKKLGILFFALLLMFSATVAGDVRISAKSTLNTETSAPAESTWWDDVVDWVNDLF